MIIYPHSIKYLVFVMNINSVLCEVGYKISLCNLDKRQSSKGTCTVYCCVQTENITLCECVSYLNVGTFLSTGFFLWKVSGDSFNVLSRLYVSVVGIT